VSLADWLSRCVSSQPQPSRRQQLQDPYYRFQSLAELRQAASLGARLDVNRATVDDWLRLPGLSIHQARTLVELNRAGVAFYCLEDIAAALGLPLQHLQPLAPVLRFCHYDGFDASLDCSADLAQPLDLNRASLEQLRQIPGLELAQAEAILKERQRGAFQNLSDLQRRLQWSGQTIAQLMYYLRC
jgi:DNA uptake protein ComE-like DNA-binding protein